jgi:hypothetical protein
VTTPGGINLPQDLEGRSHGEMGFNLSYEMSQAFELEMSDLVRNALADSMTVGVG